jgi:Wiskott-Aldrich syndrome protein
LFIAMLCSVPQSPHPSTPQPQQQTPKYPHPSRSSPLHQAVQANRTSHFAPPPTKPPLNQPISNLKSPPPARDREAPYSRSRATRPLRTSAPQALDCCKNYSSLCARSALTRPLPTRPLPTPGPPPPPPPPPGPGPPPPPMGRMRGCTPVALTRPPT